MVWYFPWELPRCTVPSKVAQGVPSTRFAKLLSQISSMRDQPPQGLSWLHWEVQTGNEGFLERVTLRLTILAELKRPGLAWIWAGHPRARGRSELSSHQHSSPSFHPPSALASAASTIKRSLKIRAESTSPARTALRLFEPHPCGTSGCFTYQLSPPEIPTGRVQVKTTAFKLPATVVKNKIQSNNFLAVCVVRPKICS